MGELRAHALIKVRNLNSYSKTVQRSNNSQKDSKMTDRKAVIKNADMSEDMQQDAVDCATQAIEKYNIEKISFLTTISFLTHHYSIEI
ncbi:unnamed protein product [Phaedon cochleariae]|uniref:Dynein light chain n=1 Tax=Phaedon cochleariae TaxID=80249 RepID=A0A9P0DPW7_PHACE|nr:unnamed protein product [Phaedon cochleariae]